MEEPSEGRKLPDAKPKRQRIKYTDVITVLVIAVVIVGLTGLLLSRLSLRRDVANAQTVADQVIADVGKKDGAAARSLGNAEFKKLYTTAVLNRQFSSIGEATHGTPTVDRQTLFTKNSKKTVYIIYKYPPRLANRSFYVRVGVTQASNKTWQLTSISGSADESQLIVQ